LLRQSGAAHGLLASNWLGVSQLKAAGIHQSTSGKTCRVATSYEYHYHQSPSKSSQEEFSPASSN
jgi:hypothetical protein